MIKRMRGLCSEERIPDLFSTASEEAKKTAISTLPIKACGTICGTICGTAREAICTLIGPVQNSTLNC